MALIFDQRHLNGPGVHVVLIGVGKFSTARAADLLGDDAPPGGFIDLETPLHSVEAFAAWLQGHLNVANTPLKTVRVLASSPVRESVLTVTPPTFQNLANEVGDWADDLDTDEDNLGIFYFCGHGLRIGEMQFLLAEDFGANRRTPFWNTFDPELFANAMRQYKARRQLFLIDACSTEVPFKRKYRNPAMGTLVQDAENENLADSEQCLIRASKLGTRAFGLLNGPSLFMDALLRAMKGGGAVSAQGQWVISTDMLKMALSWLIQSRPEGVGQEVAFGGSALSSSMSFHTVLGRPLVPVRVTCDPRDFESVSALHVNSARHSPAGGWPEDFDMPRGAYDFQAVQTTSHGTTVHGEVVQEPIAPPYTVVAIPCEDQP